jgi:hypothetical protein
MAEPIKNGGDPVNSVNSSFWETVEKVKQSPWTGVALVATAVALLAIAALCSAGVFSFVGVTTAAYITYAMYGGIALFLLAEIVRVVINQFSKTANNQEQPEAPADPATANNPGAPQPGNIKPAAPQGGNGKPVAQQPQPPANNPPAPPPPPAPQGGNGKPAAPQPAGNQPSFVAKARSKLNSISKGITDFFSKKKDDSLDGTELQEINM